MTTLRKMAITNLCSHLAAFNCLLRSDNLTCFMCRKLTEDNKENSELWCKFWCSRRVKMNEI